MHFRDEALEEAAAGITDLELAIEDMKVLIASLQTESAQMT